MSSGFNNNFPIQQGNENFSQQPNQQYHRTNTADYRTDYEQRPYNASSVSSVISNNNIREQQTSGSYEGSQMSHNTRSVYPSLPSQTYRQSNAISHFNSNPTSQQENRSFHQQYYQSSGGSQMTGNRQLPYNAPTTSICSSQEMKYVRSGEQSGLGQAPKFPAFNQPPVNSQHQTQIPVQSSINQFNSSLSIQQPNTNLQQQSPLRYPSNVVGHQISGIQQLCNPSGITRMPSPVSNQQTQCQQSRHSGPNQTSQFSMFNQMPPNSQHQSVQKSMFTPVSQTAYQNNTASHFNASDSQQTDHQQQNYVHHQYSASTYQTSNTQQQSTAPCNIPPGLTSMQSIPNQHIQHQQSNSIPCAPNQTSNFPIFNQLPPNSQYQPNQRPALTTAQTASLASVNNSFSNAPSMQQEKSFHQTQPYYQTSAINQSLFNNNKPLSQNGNTNLQQAQQQQPIAVGHQTGSPQQPFIVTSGSVSVPSAIFNPYSQAQQTSKPSEVNHLPQIPAYNSLSSSQHELHHTSVASTNSQVSAPVTVQPNLSTPVGLQYGSTTNFTNSFPPTFPVQHNFGSYQTVGSVPDASNISMKSQSEIDAEWVTQWLASRKNRKTTTVNKTSAIPIPEVRKLLSQAFTFLKALAFVRDSLKSSRNESDEVWDNKIKQAINIKQRLEAIIRKLMKPEMTLQLVRKLNRIKKKRELHRRQREKRKMEKLEQQKKRLEIHRLLDSYMETEKEKVLQAKREEELKKEADNILSEVRKKLQEGKRAQERLRAIEKLRQARKDTAQKKGLHISEDTDKQFSKKISLLMDIMHKQLQDYEAEEKALKVMLETEQEGQREQEETYRKERQKKLISNMQKRIKQRLFGDDEPLDTSDPLWYFRQYYTQAERSLDALAQIRHQWDIHLVKPTDACGSSIPVSWVIPEPPSSDAWASALDFKE